MMHRLGITFGALFLLLATTAVAQGQNVSGTIAHIEPSTGLVTFTDGRIVHLEPGATLWINGRQVTLADLKPGTVLIVKEGRVAPAGQTRSVMSPATHPPIDISGTVARFDQQTGIVTFQDGRMVKIGGQTTAWQQVTPGMLQPGTQVLLDNALPAGFQSASGAWPADQRIHMGTVRRVDPTGAVIELDNGTLVRVSPATKMHMGSQTMTLSQLQPGDQVVIRAKHTAAGVSTTTERTSPPGESPSALPRESLTGASATIEAEDIHLFRQPQAP
ncbi:MAG: hypothetical protein ACREJV_09720 [Candidatus Rokuibacteriota bacterium]